MRTNPNNVFTFILAGGVGERLRPLTNTRCKPAVYFGGNYRVVDFTLMNCLPQQSQLIGTSSLSIGLPFLSCHMSARHRFRHSLEQNLTLYFLPEY